MTLKSTAYTTKREFPVRKGVFACAGIAFALLSTTPGYGQPAADQQLELARQYVRASGLQQELESSIAQIAPHALPQRERDPGHLANFRQSLETAERLQLPPLVERITELYAREYSAAELSAAIQFYSSANGRAFAGKSAILAPELFKVLGEAKDAVLVSALQEYCKRTEVACHAHPPE